jgi:hypothetical protein
MSSCLNLSPQQLDMRVYRVIPLRRLYELFETRTNVLVSPTKWEDPFEKIVLRGLFGQCWTRHKASDAMWRIYSPKSKGVRLRTTVRALLSGLSRALPHPARAFIGGVRYLPQEKLTRFVTDAVSNNSITDAASRARLLLVKRFAFRHEREVRLVAANAHGANDILAYSVNPLVFADQIMLDPRLGPTKADQLRAEIRRRTKFKGEILWSLLYTLPSQLATLAEDGKLVSR